MTTTPKHYLVEYRPSVLVPTLCIGRPAPSSSRTSSPLRTDFGSLNLAKSQGGILKLVLVMCIDDETEPGSLCEILVKKLGKKAVVSRVRQHLRLSIVWGGGMSGVTALHLRRSIFGLANRWTFALCHHQGRLVHVWAPTLHIWFRLHVREHRQPPTWMVP